MMMMMMMMMTMKDARLLHVVGDDVAGRLEELVVVSAE